MAPSRQGVLFIEQIQMVRFNQIVFTYFSKDPDDHYNNKNWLLLTQSDCLPLQRRFELKYWPKKKGIVVDWMASYVVI